VPLSRMWIDMIIVRTATRISRKAGVDRSEGSRGTGKTNVEGRRLADGRSSQERGSVRSASGPGHSCPIVRVLEQSTESRTPTFQVKRARQKPGPKRTSGDAAF
jgi:hypothetical protein